MSPKKSVDEKVLLVKLSPPLKTCKFFASLNIEFSSNFILSPKMVLISTLGIFVLFLLASLANKLLIVLVISLNLS